MQPSLDYKKCNKIASNGFSFILLSRLIFIHDYKKEFHTHTHNTTPHINEVKMVIGMIFFFQKDTFKYKLY